MSWMIGKLGLNRPSPLLELLGAYAVAEATRTAIERLRGYKQVLTISDEQREQITITAREFNFGASDALLKRRKGTDKSVPFFRPRTGHSRPPRQARQTPPWFRRSWVAPTL
jgi:hypothetical protein